MKCQNEKNFCESFFFSISCVRLFNVNFHVGRLLGQLLIIHFFFFLFKLPPLPPTRSTQTHFFLPTPVLLCPSTLLSLFKAAIYFQFYHFINSPNDSINECITF